MLHFSAPATAAVSVAGLKRRPPASRESPPGIGGCSRRLPGGGRGREEWGAGRGRGSGCAVGVGRAGPAAGALPPRRGLSRSLWKLNLPPWPQPGRPRRRWRRAVTLRAGGGPRPAAGSPAPRRLRLRPSPRVPAGRRLFPGRQAGGAVLLLNPPAGGFSPFRARGGERGSGLNPGRRAGLGRLRPFAGSPRASPAPPSPLLRARKRAARVTFLHCYLPIAGHKAR